MAPSCRLGRAWRGDHCQRSGMLMTTVVRFASKFKCARSSASRVCLQYFLGASELPQTEDTTLYFHFKDNKPEAAGLGKGLVRKVLAVHL